MSLESDLVVDNKTENSSDQGGGDSVDFIQSLLEARAAALLPATVVRQDNNVTYTNVTVAFVNDSAVGLAVSGQIRVIPIDRILEVR